MNTPEQKAQIARVNRVLGKSHLKLRTSSPRQSLFIGSHYIVDTYRNVIILPFIKPEELRGTFLRAVIEVHGWIPSSSNCTVCS